MKRKAMIRGGTGNMRHRKPLGLQMYVLQATDTLHSRMVVKYVKLSLKFRDSWNIVLRWWET
jgi:hypothetical protein